MIGFKYEPQSFKPSPSPINNFGKPVERESRTERSRYTAPKPAGQKTRYRDDTGSGNPRYSPYSRSSPTPSSDDMSDGKNEARAMRILEIMNDFRTLQHHISSLITRPAAHPPDQEAYYFDGYVVLRQCSAESQAILASHYNPGNLGIQSGQLSESEVEKATLQRIILDSSTRRFQAHKIYLRAAAAMRWVSLRQQLMQGVKATGQHVHGLRRIDDQLRQELDNITDEHVNRDLRAADRRKGYWQDEDPSLERMLQWIRLQR